MDTAIILEGNKSSTCKMATPASSSHLRSDENEQPMSQPLCDVQMSLPSSPSQACGERNEAGMVIHAMSEPSGTLGVEPQLVFDINDIMVTSQRDGRHAQSNSQHALPLPSMSGFVEPHCSLLATSPHSSLQACGNLMEDDKVTQAMSEAGITHGAQPQQVVGPIGIKASSHRDGRNAHNLSQLLMIVARCVSLGVHMVRSLSKFLAAMASRLLRTAMTRMPSPTHHQNPISSHFSRDASNSNMQ